MRQLKLSKAFTLMESGPVVLVTTHDGQKDNIMTISWTMVMDFTPVFAITTGEWNHSFAALRKNRECVIAIPTVDMLDKVVGIGTCSGKDTAKFAKFKLTPVQGKVVRSPLIKECLANIECKVIDIVKKHNIVVLEAVAAYIDTARKEKRTAQIHRLPSLHPPSPQKRIFDGEIGVKFLYPWPLPLLLAVSGGFWACFGRRCIPAPQSIAIERMIRTIRTPPGPVGLSATGLR